MTPTITSKSTPIETMAFLGMSLDDIVRITGLGRAAVQRAVYGSDHCINRGTAKLIAEAFGMSILDIDWPSELTSSGRPPLTGGTYTIGVGDAKQKTAGGMGQPLTDKELASLDRKRRFLSEELCDNPEHNLVLAVSGVCDLCIA